MADDELYISNRCATNEESLDETNENINRDYENETMDAVPVVISTNIEITREGVEFISRKTKLQDVDTHETFSVETEPANIFSVEETTDNSGDPKTVTKTSEPKIITSDSELR